MTYDLNIAIDQLSLYMILQKWPKFCNNVKSYSDLLNKINYPKDRNTDSTSVENYIREHEDLIEFWVL